MVRYIQLLMRLDWARFGDLMRAGIELGIARVRLPTQHVRTLIAAPPAESTVLAQAQIASVERVAFAIPRVALHLPWRADCLVQAIAAKRWLAQYGVATTLRIGVRRDPSVAFEAHAWLTAGDMVVTGGDTAGHTPLTRN